MTRCRTWRMRASLWAALVLTAGCDLVLGVDEFQVTGGGQGGTTSTGGTGGTTSCNPADCPAPSGECKKAVCTPGGACAEEALADGTEPGTQIPGDCRKIVCQGGVVTSQDDDADIEDDGTSCTSDTCSGGEAKHASVAPGSPCDDGGGKVCNDGGTCVECNVDAHCAGDPEGNEKCDAGHVCVPASCADLTQNGDETDVDCGGTECAKCTDGLDCLSASDCLSNVCGPPPASNCVAGTCEDGILNNIQLGETDVDCGGPTCPKCTVDEACAIDSDCVGGLCSEGHCAPTCSDTLKNQDESDVDCGGVCGDCENGESCQSAGDCASNFCDAAAGECAPCAATASCAPAQFCTNGVCKSDKAIGEACGASVECTSNNCVDGVCCNSTCSSTCKACNLPGLLGTCSNIPAGQQDYFPANACTGVNHCNDSGVCMKGLGQSCDISSECESGKCVDDVCCNSTCLSTCKSCKVTGSVGTCVNLPVGQSDYFPDGACSGDYACNGSGVCKEENGETCSAASECASNYCVDGRCCDTSCTGVCRACNVFIFDGSTQGPGKCLPIFAGDDPGNECSSPGKLDCNGAGACGKGPEGVYCHEGEAGVCLNGNCPSASVMTPECP